MHSRETAVGALELFTDHREVIHYRRTETEEGRKGERGGGERERKKEGGKRGLVLNEAHLNKLRRHFSVITFN